MWSDWIRPRWPAPRQVLAFCTTRTGGVSSGPWSSMNLGTRCEDDPASVEQNRARLQAALPAPVQWLRQVHGATVVEHPGRVEDEREGDALVAFHPDRVCAVLTADCLPVIFCNRGGDRVAVAHAGWRGLAGGVLQAAIGALGGDPADLMAWMGPAIGPRAYEVGQEVAEAFPAEFDEGFVCSGGRYLLDLYAVAKMKLTSAGVRQVYGGGRCTLGEPEHFFSFRRDGITGRMASVVWLDASAPVSTGQA